MTTRRLLLRTIVTGACVTAAVAIVVLLSGSLDGTSGRVLLTTTAISIFGVLAVPAQMLLDRGTLQLLARASAVLTGASFGVTVVLIWVTADRPGGGRRGASRPHSPWPRPRRPPSRRVAGRATRPPSVVSWQRRW